MFRNKSTCLHQKMRRAFYKTLCSKTKDEFLNCLNGNQEGMHQDGSAPTSAQARRVTAQVMAEMLTAADAAMQRAAWSLFLLIDMTGPTVVAGLMTSGNTVG